MMWTSFFLPKLLQLQLAERMLQRPRSGGCGGFDVAAATTSAISYQQTHVIGQNQGPKYKLKTHTDH